MTLKVPEGNLGGRRRQGEAQFKIVSAKTRHGRPTWRVQGFDRTGKRIRESFQNVEAARARAHELEAQWMEREISMALRPTRLTPDELAVVEAAVLRLGDPMKIGEAVDLWLAHEKKLAAEGARNGDNGPTLGEAMKQFFAWVDSSESGLRAKSQFVLKGNLKRFQAECRADAPVQSFTADSVEEILNKRWPSQPIARDGTRRAASRFFSWCAQRPRRWIAHNPASGELIRIRKPKDKEPEILSLREAARLLVAAQRFHGGKFLSYVVYGLFAGIRPTEAVRLRVGQANLKDGELRIEPAQAKKGKSRPVQLPPAAVEWLKACPADQPVKNPEKSRLLWDQLRTKAKINRWPHDVLRHTGISYYFRLTGSYGLTAERSGNSEDVIKKHYQGRVSTEEAAKFWAWRPLRSRPVRE